MPDVNTNDPLPAIQVDEDAGEPGVLVPFVPTLLRGDVNAKAHVRAMTLAHLVAVLAALPEATQRTVWEAALPNVHMLAEDWTDAECDRILEMTDEEIDAEIVAAGENLESVKKWSRATGKWMRMLAEASARQHEEKARADRAEQRVRELEASLCTPAKYIFCDFEGCDVTVEREGELCRAHQELEKPNV
jgi:hypothetical protein